MIRILVSLLLIVGFSSAQFFGFSYVARRGFGPPGECPTEEEVFNDLAQMKPYGNTVKLYNLYDCEGGMKVAKAAKELGMDLYLGMQNTPLYILGWEKSIMLDIINTYGSSNILGVVVGCESLARQDVPPHEIAHAILEVKEFVNDHGWKFPLGVGYADDRNLAANRTNYTLIREAADTLLFNLFTYYDGGYPTNNTDYNPSLNIINTTKHYKEQYPDKIVILGESGWPSQSSNKRSPIDGKLLQQYIAETLVCQCQSEGIMLFWFQSHDLKWKYNDDNPEGSWGLWTYDRKWKHPGWSFSCPTTEATSSSSIILPVVNFVILLLFLL